MEFWIRPLKKFGWNFPANAHDFVWFLRVFGHEIANFGDMVIKITENVQLGGTSELNLVSLKNIDMWQSYGQNSIRKYQLFHI